MIILLMKIRTRTAATFAFVLMCFPIQSELRADMPAKQVPVEQVLSALSQSFTLLIQAAPDSKRGVYEAAKARVETASGWNTDSYTDWLKLCSTAQVMDHIAAFMKLHTASAIERARIRFVSLDNAFKQDISRGCRNLRWPNSQEYVETQLLLLVAAWQTLFYQLRESETIPVQEMTASLGASLASLQQSPVHFYSDLLSYLELHEENLDALEEYSQNSELMASLTLIQGIYAKLERLHEDNLELVQLVKARRASLLSISVDERWWELAQLWIPRAMNDPFPTYVETSFSPYFSFTYISPSRLKTPDRKLAECTLHKPKRAYEIQVQRVSTALYLKVMGHKFRRVRRPSLHTSDSGDGMFVRLTQREAESFAARLTKLRADGYVYRLPTVAEWFFAKKVIKNRSRSEWVTGHEKIYNFEFEKLGMEDFSRIKSKIEIYRNTSQGWVEPFVRLVREPIR